MAKTIKATEPVGMTTAYRYSPGDGHVYTWTGQHADPIKVWRVAHHGGRVEVDTGDTIQAPDRSTATALMDVVDTWRQAIDPLP